ncbi:MAG: 4'-phosphopantetheinyl transferase superfamily protein [Bacteroidales bacterium]|nr:4'-phosphopantetheinyl transferase superfamily protein [Candidatus Liminaster caballi]
MNDRIVWKITETEQELLSQFEHPEYFAEKIANLKDGSRRKLEVLAVRRAIKELFYGEEQQVLYDADGKPYLPDISNTKPAPHISISHTDGYCAVIVSTDFPVGIDIERIGRRVERVIGHFLMPEELVILNMSAETISLNILYHLAWSAKETAYKVLGRKYYDLQHQTSIINVDVPAQIIVIKAAGIDQPMTIHFDLSDDYVLTWTEVIN